MYNPICGIFFDPQKAFECASTVFTKYQKRISGHLLYLIDINIEALQVDHKKLVEIKIIESSKSIRGRVQTARYTHSQIPSL